MNASPFSPRAVLALVLGGGLLFVAVLWMLGNGMGGGDANDGGAHVGGKGLTGYAALAQMLEAQGTTVRRSRTRAAYQSPGVLVLTPPHTIEAKDIEKIVNARRKIGPTLIVAPKWQAAPFPVGTKGVQKGWVKLFGAEPPKWLTGITNLDQAKLEIVQRKRWDGMGHSGVLPAPQSAQVLVASSLTTDEWTSVMKLVTDENGDVLAGYLNDDGYYPPLDAASGFDPVETPDKALWPVILVAEPDLLDNYGMGDSARAKLALDLVRSAMNGKDLPVYFDLTLPGHGTGQNLLTLAFTPPFVAATLCLLLAALVVGWRGFARFGPPLAVARAIAFGKTALVSNAAGLLRRARRLHLLGGPYADAARERLARALALPHRLDAEATEAAIDRALAARSPEARPFSLTAAALRAARRPRELVRAAHDLHSLERTLTR